eukprot:1724261-Ditylum_brightwellii.AAC.1
MSVGGAGMGGREVGPGHSKAHVTVSSRLEACERNFQNGRNNGDSSKENNRKSSTQGPAIKDWGDGHMSILEEKCDTESS